MGSTTLENKIYIIGGTGGPSGWIGYNSVYEGSFSDANGLGVHQSNEKDVLLIYPNPAKNYIQVQAIDHHHKLESFQILTLDGKIKQGGILKSDRINISGLNTGMFLLNIKTDNGKITKRFVIEH